MQPVRGTLLFCLLSAALPWSCYFAGNAQAAEQIVAPPMRLQILDAISLADQRYPRIREAFARESAGKARVELARTAYLPTGSLAVQELRATSNNITGPLFPQMVIPQISGAVKARNDMTGGWLSGAGMLLGWQPFDFGLRKAHVDVARYQTQQASAEYALTRLESEANAANSFLAALAAQQAVKAAQAKLQRMKVFAETVTVLAQKELRPTTDQYLAQAEEARARDQLTEAEQSLDLSLAGLGRAMGLPECQMTIDAGGLLAELPQFALTNPVSVINHPAVLAQSAAVSVRGAERRAIERSYYPRFELLSALYGRGSGFRNDVSIDQSTGYYPSKFNYAVGLSITFPFLDYFQLKAQHKVAVNLEAAERARYDLAVLDINSRNIEARAYLKAARRLMENAPVKLKAAQEAAKSVEIRYRYGLASVNDVAQDEELYTEAQVQYATAQLRVWQALLRTAVANGDMAEFSRLVQAPAPGHIQ